MNNWYNNYSYGNTMPTGTQPYGYPVGPFNSNAMQQGQVQQNQPQTPTNTNKIYVSGVDDVRSRYLLPNSDYIFLDNDKAILYQKVVDGNGHFEVKTFSITPYEPQDEQKATQAIDLSAYVKQTDLEPLHEEIRALKKQFETKKTEVVNNAGTTSQTGTSQTGTTQTRLFSETKPSNNASSSTGNIGTAI